MDRFFVSILEKAIKAPSGHNTQPWKFKVQDNTITILPDYERALPVVDADNHALFISLGCALENIVIAGEHYGFDPIVNVYAEEKKYIEVKMICAAKNKSNSLFDQIDNRQSTRNKYNGQPIPATDIELLKAAARQHDVRCLFVTTEQEMEPVIELVKEASILQFSNKAFVAELMHWIRFNKTKAEETNDGLYGASTGNPPVPEWFGKFFMNLTTTPEKEAKKCEALIRSSSGLVIFIAKRNDARAWINLGRSFERFALTATSLHIHQAHENMPCEEVSVRKKLAKHLRLEDDEQPLLLIRIGYSDKMPYSYRRPLEELLLVKESVS